MLKPLDLHGSRCSAVCIDEAPMGEEARVSPTNPNQPCRCPFWSPMQALEFAICPTNQISVNATKDRTKSRSIEVPVVVDPATDGTIVQPGQILQGFVASVVERPPLQRLSHCLQRLRTDRGQERDDGLISVPDRFPRPKLIAQKIEGLVRVVTTPVHILAVDELSSSADAESACRLQTEPPKRFLNARASSALRQWQIMSSAYRSNGICRKGPRHPLVEDIVQKQDSQESG